MNSIKASTVKGFSKSAVFVMAQLFVVYSGVQSMKMRRVPVSKPMNVVGSIASGV